MENEEYTKFRLEYETKLIAIRNIFSNVPMILFNNTYSDFNEMTYYLSLVNKAIELIDGFIDLLINKNLTCLSLILRVQLDNCMRTYAGFIVEDKVKYFDEFRKLNSRLNKMKDISGKKLTDANLRKYLNQFDNSFGDAYAKASKFVHHTDSSLMTMMKINDKSEIEFDIGNPNNELGIDSICTVTKSFVYFLEMQYSLIEEIYKLKKIKQDSSVLSKENS